MLGTHMKIFKILSPGTSLVKTLHLYCRGASVQSLIGELRSPHATCGQKKEKIFCFQDIHPLLVEVIL